MSKAHCSVHKSESESVECFLWPYGMGKFSEWTVICS